MSKAQKKVAAKARRRASRKLPVQEGGEIATEAQPEAPEETSEVATESQDIDGAIAETEG